MINFNSPAEQAKNYQLIWNDLDERDTEMSIVEKRVQRALNAARTFHDCYHLTIRLEDIISDRKAIAREIYDVEEWLIDHEAKGWAAK